MNTPIIETILGIAGEGGGYDIETMLSPEGRLFRRKSAGMGWDDDLDEEVYTTNHGEWHPSLAEVFAELNSGWYQLHPVRVHPEFASEMWKHFVAACEEDSQVSHRQLGKWTECLLGRAFDSLQEAKAFMAAAKSLGLNSNLNSRVKQPHWQEFAQRLQAVLVGLEEDQFLVITHKETNHYVQFAAQGAKGIRVEATSNHYLTGREKLGEQQVRAMLKLGWQRPTGTPQEATPEKQPNGSSNYFLDKSNPLDFEAIAALAVNTLSGVYGVPHAGFLKYEALDYAGNHFALPELQLKREVRDDKLKMGELADLLLNVLRETTQVPDLEFDEDGDVLLQARNVSTYLIRLVGRPPMVQFSTHLLEDIPKTKKWLEMANALNVMASPVRFVVHEKNLIATLDIPAWPLHAEHVTSGLERFDAAIQVAEAWLEAEELGGLSKFH